MIFEIASCKYTRAFPFLILYDIMFRLTLPSWVTGGLQREEALSSVRYKISFYLLCLLLKTVRRVISSFLTITDFHVKNLLFLDPDLRFSL